MANGFSRDRLQPALLDRLIDEDPRSEVESLDGKVITRARLRQSVLRDLSWLFNAVGTWHIAEEDGGGDGGAAAASVLNFGLPPLAGSYVSRLDPVAIERALIRAITVFEPRLQPGSVHVKAIEREDGMATHNVLTFEISALLWAQPYPLELLLRTQLDVETGRIRLEDQLADTSQAER